MDGLVKRLNKEQIKNETWRYVLILYILVFIVGIMVGFLGTHLFAKKPTLVGRLLINNIVEDDAPYLLLELEEDIKALDELDIVSLQIVRR